MPCEFSDDMTFSFLFIYLFCVCAVDPAMNPMTGNHMMMNEPSSVPMLSAPDGMPINRAPVLTSTPMVRPGCKGKK